MAALPPLDKLDPAEAWAPWKPSADQPWNRKWVAHLYRRAAFGATNDELVAAEKRGVTDTLELLLKGQPGANELVSTLNDTGRVAATRDAEGVQLRGWWLYCMLQGGHPLREKLVLFWHNHFATSIAKVRDPNAMFQQNRLFRQHALGKFEPFLQAVSRDPAMLVWLDSNSNAKGKPNENYAREVMELFSLGVGNYTEKDIREAARAFTGWHTDGTSFRFSASIHDTDPKTVFGKTGNWDGEDIVKMLLEQPAAARFLVGKLYAFYVSETPPPEKLLEPLCESFRKSEYDVAAVLKTMLASRLFFSDHAFRKRIKSPVEYALGGALSIYRRYDDKDPHSRPLPHQALVKWIGSMGQILFAPPNVKGWPGGRTWLNTATLLDRDNFAAVLATGELWIPAAETSGFAINPDVPPPRAFDSARVVDEEKASKPEDVVRVLLDAYVPGGVREAAREKLVAFVADGKPTGRDFAKRVRETVHAILTMPEYQLC